MRQFKKIIIAASCLMCFAGCNAPNKDGLDEFRDKGQLIDLDYETLDSKLINKESFVFYLKQEGCSSCERFYPVVSEFLMENEDAKICSLNFNDLEALETLTIASYFFKALGNSYYQKHEYSSTTLYTPTIAKVLDGEFIDVKIGAIDKENLTYLYQDNYLSLNTYYGFNRKVQNKNSFNLFVSKNKDVEYDKLLREYFINNASVSGYYLDASEFDTSDNTKLLDRINYYLGEETALDALPDYYLLQYEDGILTNYISAKYDVSSLNTLYNIN